MTIAEKNKKFAAVLAAGSVALAGMGTMAWFTDNAQGDVTATIADNPIDIVPNDADKNGESDKTITAAWAEVIPPNYNPGDSFKLPLQLYNNGTDAVDLRETIVIKSTVAMTADEYQFMLKKAVAATPVDTDNMAYDTEDDGTDIGTGVVSDGGKTYTITAYSDLAAKTEVVKDYSLIFDKNAGNDFQGAIASIDYTVEAKMSNGGDESLGWTEIAVGSASVVQQ